MEFLLKNRLILLILVISLAHGLVYVFLIPPWQHYDEPNHFEVAWLIAHRGHLPTAGEYDQEMRRAVATSMLQHGFFKGLSYQPDLNATDQPIWIGAQSQAGDPPLQYLLAAVPLWLARSAGIDVQLYLARLVSLVLFLVTIYVTSRMIEDLTGPENPLRWMVPGGMALLPGFVDMMTSFNNDVVAVAMFAIFLWACIRTIKLGVTLPRLLWVILSAVLCILSKGTVYLAVLLLPLALILAMLQRGIWRWIRWGLLAVIVIVGAFAAMTWGDAALWYRQTNQSDSTRYESTSAPLGSHVFRLDVTREASAQGLDRLSQLLLSSAVQTLSSKGVTLGAWMWASQAGPSAVLSLVVEDSNGQYFNGVRSFSLTSSPAYYAFQAALPPQASRAWITISSDPQTISAPVTIYMDGLVLTEGKFPLDEAPQMKDTLASSGVWGGEAFTNLLRNASAEQAWPRFFPWVDRLGAKILPDHARPSIVLYSLLDQPGAGWYYKTTAENLFRTFWGKFGWGHVPLVGERPYRLLGIITLIGLIGLVFTIGWRSEAVNWESLIFMALAAVSIWGFTWARGSFYLFYRPFIPSARYAYPVIASTLGLICLGWFAIARFIRRWVPGAGKIGAGLFIAFWIGLDILAIVSIIGYYYT